MSYLIWKQRDSTSGGVDIRNNNHVEGLVGNGDAGVGDGHGGGKDGQSQVINVTEAF